MVSWFLEKIVLNLKKMPWTPYNKTQKDLLLQNLQFAPFFSLFFKAFSISSVKFSFNSKADFSGSFWNPARDTWQILATKFGRLCNILKHPKFEDTNGWRRGTQEASRNLWKSKKCENGWNNNWQLILLTRVKNVEICALLKFAHSYENEKF